MGKRVAVVTGGGHGIGKAVADCFRRSGAEVYVIDKQQGDWFVGDVGDKDTLERFAKQVIENAGRVDYLIHNALPIMKGIDACTYEEFQYALSVGVTAPFYLTKLLAPYFSDDASIVNISSSRDRMSQPQTESYTAAKGGKFCRKGAGKQYFARMDPHRRRNNLGTGCLAATCRSGRQAGGYRGDGNVSLFGEGWIYHWREHLHRWRYDKVDDLSWRERMDVPRVTA